MLTIRFFHPINITTPNHIKENIMRYYIVLIMVAILLFPGPILSQTGELVSSLALFRLLESINNDLQTMMTQVDSSMRNRIEDIFNRISALMKEIEEMRKRAITDLNMFRHSFTKDFHDVVLSIKDISNSLATNLYIKLNQTLINAANIIDKIPFAKKTKPYIFAVEPSVLDITDSGRMIKIYGYFRDLSEKFPAIISILGTEYKITKPGVGNTISFNLPNSIDLSEYDGKRITYSIKLNYRTKSLLLFNKTRSSSFSDFIFIRKYKPYNITVKSTSEDPRSYESISLPHEAHSNNTTSLSIQRTISARDMFTGLYPNAGNYDLSSVCFQNVTARTDEGKPCRCTSVLARFDGWNRDNLSYTLTSSCMGGHWVSIAEYHGGGCSHADIWIDMTVIARRLNIADLSSELTDILKRNSSKNFTQCPQYWKRTIITANYDDGIGNAWSEIATITPTNPANSIIKSQGGLEINASSGSIIINTRD